MKALQKKTQIIVYFCMLCIYISVCFAFFVFYYLFFPKQESSCIERKLESMLNKVPKAWMLSSKTQHGSSHLSAKCRTKSDTLHLYMLRLHKFSEGRSPAQMLRNIWFLCYPDFRCHALPIITMCNIKNKKKTQTKQVQAQTLIYFFKIFLPSQTLQFST